MATFESPAGTAGGWAGPAAAERRGVLTYRRGVAGLVLLMWLVPMKLYRLPVHLPFNLEPYRLYLIVLIGCLAVGVLVGGVHVTAAGNGRALAMLGAAAVAAQFANWGAIQAATSGQALKSLSYFVSVLVVFVVVATAMETREDVEAVVRVVVAGACIVGLSVVYEAHRHYNVFAHLQSFLPFLHYLGQTGAAGATGAAQGLSAVRLGTLRVRGSAQDPIALGVVLAMCLPLGVHVASRARTRLRSRAWLLATLVVTAGALATVSRTVVVMLVSMLVVGLILRKRAITRRWPVLIVLLAVVHFASPGAMSHLARAFNPKGGLVAQQAKRSGQVGSGRLADFGPGLKTWAKEPIFGYGLGTGANDDSGQPVGRQIVEAGAPVIFDDQYLGGLVSMGIVGLVAIVWFVWGTVLKLGRAARRGGAHTDLLAACAVACTGFGVSMATFDAFSFVQSTFMFFVVAALGLRARALISAQAPARSR